MPRLLGLALLTLLLAACGGPATPSASVIAPCDASGFYAQVEPLARKWDDAAQLAGNTPRVSLAPQIAALQDIRRQVQDVSTPPCAEPTRQSLVAAMDSTIQGYLDFLAQKPESEVQASFVISLAHMTEFEARLRSLQSPEAAAQATATAVQVMAIALTPTATPIVPTATPLPVIAASARVRAFYQASGYTETVTDGTTTLTSPDETATIEIKDDSITINGPYAGDLSKLQLFMEFARQVTGQERFSTARRWVENHQGLDGTTIETYDNLQLTLELRPNDGFGRLTAR